MRNNLLTKWEILSFIFLLVLWGCVGASGVSEPHPARSRPSTSPTKVVAGFLDALKKDDFGKAYEFVYAPFSDRDGYILQMKNLVEDHNISFLDYSILGSRILGDTAIVVAELEVELRPGNSDTEIHERWRNQYDLTIMEGNWRITSDKCILNCTNAGDSAGRMKQ